MRLAKRALQINSSPTLAIDAKAKQMLAEGLNVLNFGIGEPDFNTPQNIKQAGIEAINQNLTRYTAVAGTEELRRAIVKKLKTDNGLEYQTNEIVVSSGAKHSLYNALQVLCEVGDEVIVPAPFWVSYLEQIKLAGGVPKVIYTNESDGFKLKPEVLEAAIGEKTTILILTSPNNPTGAVYTRQELQELGKIIEKHNLYVISDEIYEKLIYDNLNHLSVAAISPRLKELTVVINGVSKAYAMTGWRIGYSASAAPAAKAMAALQSHSTSNPVTISQKASVEALTGNQQSVVEMLGEFRARRDYMLQRLQAMSGVTCTKPGGAFYLYPNISSFFGKKYKDIIINDSTQFAQLLLEEALVAVVPGIAFGTDTNIRLSYATSMDNIREGMDRLEHILSQIK